MYAFIVMKIKIYHHNLRSIFRINKFNLENAE